MRSLNKNLITGNLSAGIQILILCVSGILILTALWRIYRKAGEKGWKCLIPVYNCYTLYQMVWSVKYFWILFAANILYMVTYGYTNRNACFLLLYSAAYVTILMLLFAATYKLAKAFGHSLGFTLGMLVLPVIFYPVLGFGSSGYKGPN